MNFLSYTWRNRHPHVTAAITHIRHSILFRNQSHLEAALKWANENNNDFAIEWITSANVTKVILRSR